MNIEDDLQRALRRKPAPPDLADRVLARLETGRVQTSNARRMRASWLATAAALILAVSGGTRYYLQQQEAAEAERVKQEIRLALQITSDMFARAPQRIEATTETP